MFKRNSVITEKTNGINIAVYPKFELLTEKDAPGFLFQYTIHITNTNSFDVKLMKRHWYIFDSNHSVTYVNGDGVIGVMPRLTPEQTFIYSSACKLNSDCGYMKGQYTFVNVLTEEDFRVNIPMFNLMFPPRLN